MHEKKTFLDLFLDGGEFKNCHGVISGNHTRQAYVNIGKLIESGKLKDFPEGLEGFKKAKTHPVSNIS